MIGGWGPWERFKVARRLARHARREGGEPPPPDLLRRLREDIPPHPGLGYRPAGLADAGDPRPRIGRPSPRFRPAWVAAAALATAVTAGVIGLRVLQHHTERAEEAAAAVPGGQLGTSGAVAAGGSSAPGAVPGPGDRASAVAGPTGGEVTGAGSEPQPIVAPPSGYATGAAEPAPPGPLAGVASVGPPAAPPLPPAGARLRGGQMPAAAGGHPVAVPGSAASGGAAQGNPQGPRMQTPRGQEAEEAPVLDLIPGTAAPPAAEKAARQAGPRSGRLPAEAQRAAAPSPPPPPAAAGEAPLAAENTAPAPPATAALAGRVAGLAGPASGMRSAFGAATGTDGYRALRRDLAAGRLPAPASVRVDQLANAFVVPGDVSAENRLHLAVEGAPPATGGNVYLLRFSARGLGGVPNPDAVTVEFNPRLVARFRRVGAAAGGGAASALYEVELRAPAAPAVAGVEVLPPDGIATVRLPGRDEAGEGAAGAGGAAAQDGAAAPAEPATAAKAVAAGPPAAALLQVRLGDLQRSWAAASPALRLPGLAVQLGQALAIRDPAHRLRALQALRSPVRELAAELPGEPRAGELLRLVERATSLAAAPGIGSPPP